jgi:hypothetical protein
MRGALQLVGFLLLLLGIHFLPTAPGINPERDLSAFSNLADTGLFQRYGLWIAGIGLAVMLASLLIRRDGF